MKVFTYDKKIIEELNGRKRKMGLITILDELILLVLFFIFKPFETNEESTAFFLVMLFLGMSIFFLTLFFIEVGRFNQAILNVQKNKITLNEENIHIIYITDYLKPNTENFIEIKFSEIKSIEIISPNTKVAEYCNLQIFASFGMYKISVENPIMVKNAIMKINDKNYVPEKENCTHKWMCECGAMISATPCIYCGKDPDNEEKIPEGFWKCMGCGELISNDLQECKCGYKKKVIKEVIEH